MKITIPDTGSSFRVTRPLIEASVGPQPEAPATTAPRRRRSGFKARREREIVVLNMENQFPRKCLGCSCGGVEAAVEEAGRKNGHGQERG
jgi:hypothetical protein